MAFHYQYLITAIILLLILLVVTIKHKDILCAPVIYPILWIASLFVLTFSTYMDGVSISVLVIAVVSYVFFYVGFMIPSFRTDGFNVSYEKPKYNWLGIQLVFCIAIVIGLIYVYYVFSFISISDFIKNPLLVQQGINNGLYSIPKIIVWLGVFIRCSFWYYSYLFFSSFGKTKSDLCRHKIILRIEYIIVILLTTIWQITHFSRNGILYTLLPVLMMFFLVRKKSNKTIFVLLVLGVLAFLGFFFWFNSYKFSWDYNSSSDASNLNGKYLSLYLCSSFVGLTKLIDSSQIGLFAANGFSHTFSLPLSVFDTIFGTSYSPDVVQEFTEVGLVGRANVYTVLHWTASDFGIFYSFVWLIIYGIIYGKVYKQARLGNSKAIYFYSLLFYALCMMFFQDQLLAISESWFFIVVFSLLIFALCERQPKTREMAVFYRF